MKPAKYLYLRLVILTTSAEIYIQTIHGFSSPLYIYLYYAFFTYIFLVSHTFVNNYFCT